MKPILGDLIKEGVDKRVFDVKYPYSVAELVMVYITEAFDYERNLSKDEENNKIRIFMINLERLLGLEEGTLEEIIDGQK